MDFKLTQTQELMRKMVAEFAKKEIEPLASKIDEEQTFPAEIVKKLAALNLLGINVPPQYGGAGIDTVSFVLIIEELSKASATVGAIVNVHNALCNYMLVHYGSEELKKKYLPALARGEKIGAFALTESFASSDIQNLHTIAKAENGHYTLRGCKLYITNGAVADIIIAVAKFNGRVSAFVVENTCPGFSVGRPESLLGLRGTATASIYFEDCIVPEENILGCKDWKDIRKALNLHKLGACAQAIGVGEAATEAAIAYSNKRVQFGQTISRFQAVQWMIVDAAIQLKASKLLLYKAASLCDAGEDYALAATEAKAYASETAKLATYNALQVHGGLGYMREYPIERYYRDAKTMEFYGGSIGAQKKYVAETMLNLT